jgi:hypothetical protein
LDAEPDFAGVRFLSSLAGEFSAKLSDPTFSSGRLPTLVDSKTEVEEEARELGLPGIPLHEF